MPSEAELRLIPRVILPRHGRGIDYGAPRRLLIRAGTDRTSRVLAITAGVRRAATGVRGMGYVYHPAVLGLGYVDNLTEKNLAQGRITRAVLTQHRDAIDAWFGIPGITGEIVMGRTLEIVPSSVV